MNSVKTDQANLAITSTFLGFMQSALQELQKLANIAGDNYILSGCVVNGSVVSAGYVIINGELLEFKAGNLTTYVIIRETEETHEIQEGNHIVITRWVEFGVGTGQIAWTSLKRIKTNQELETSISNLNTALTGEITRVEDEADAADQALQDQITDNYSNIDENADAIDENANAIAVNVINIAGKAAADHDHNSLYALNDLLLMKSTLGYWNLGNGLQIRWGTWTSYSDNNITVNFRIPFTTACFVVVSDEYIQQTSVLKYADKFIINRADGVDGSKTRNYIAIGY